MMSMVESRVEEKKDGVVDRERICPMLLRMFVCNGRHHPLSDYRRGSTPPNGLQVYTWKDATLKELSNLVQEINPETKRRGTVFEFALIYIDQMKLNVRTRELGTVIVGQQGFEDNTQLGQSTFSVGDHIDVAVSYPSVRPTAPPMRGRRGPYMGGRPDYDNWGDH